MAKFGDTISSPTCDYFVQDTVGSGGFGTVVVCNKKNTPDLVALKIIQNEKAMASSKNETNIMKKMRELGSHNFNIITWADSFMAGDLFCMELERLDISIHDYMKKESFNLKEIRPLIQQMSVALQFLGANGLIHADLKPQNIMLVDHIREPLRFKLIDFGLAHSVPGRHTGRVCGTFPYIAPEMLLGAPYTNAIDTWALGCVAAQMISRKVLLPGANAAEVLSSIISRLGAIPNHVINFGYYSQKYFFIAYAPYFQSFAWILRQPFMSTGGTNLVQNCIQTLNELLMGPKGTTLEDNQAEVLDRISSVELISKMLNIDPYHRITPSDILKHPFITLSHLDSNYDSYRQDSINIMRVCPEWCADEKKHVPPCSSATSSSDQSSRESPALQNNSSGQKNSKSKSPTIQNNSRKRKRDESEQEIDASPFLKRKISKTEDQSKKRKRDESEPETDPSPFVERKIPKTEDQSKKRKRDESEQETDPSPFVKQKIPKTEDQSEKRKSDESEQETDPSPFVERKIPKTEDQSKKRKRDESEQETDPSPFVKQKIPKTEDQSEKRKSDESEQETDPSPFVKRKIPKTEDQSRKRKRDESEQETDPSPFVKRKIPKTEDQSKKRKRDESEQETDPSPFVKRKIPQTEDQSRKRKRNELEQDTDPCPFVKRKIPKTEAQLRQRKMDESKQEADPYDFLQYC